MRNRDFNRRKNFIFFLPKVVLLAVILGFAVMFLWNCILPEVAHVGKLNYWQALGLLALCRLLFGNFGKGGGPTAFSDKRREMRSKWQAMNEEERARFKEEYKRRCAAWRPRNKE